MTLYKGQLILHRYRVDKKLGAGAMGEVWRGVHQDLEMPVAIKILLHQEHPELLRRFSREARLMALVRHPNVVQILDYGLLEGDLPCIVMELLSGLELEALLARPVQLSTSDIALLGAQMLRGLTAMHEAGVIHRDVKPANMMVFESANDIHVKLVDFGIAKPATDAIATRLTQTGMLIGTPAYMAPEQLLGMDVSAKTDVYAVGLILYEMLTGTLPWGAETMATIMRRVRDDIPPPEHDGPFSALLMRMLDFEPEVRPAPTQAIQALDALQTPSSPAPAHGVILKRKRRRKMVHSAAPPRRTHTPNASPNNQANGAPARRGATMASTPTPMEPPAPQTSRIFAVLIAKFPPSRLRQREERAWLKELMTGRGIGLSLGAQLWIALFQATTQERADASRMHVRGALAERYAGLVTSRDTQVGADFSFTAATLSGAAQLPKELQDLIAQLA